MKNILLWFWIILLIILIYYSSNKQVEGFTPKIRSYYRPHLRNLRLSMETFHNYFPYDYFVKKFRNFGIY